jgi:hypothetical protein
MNKSTIRQLVGQDKLKEALKQFLDMTDDEETENELTGFSSHLERLESKIRKGTIATDTANLELAQIRDSILSLLSSFHDASDNNTTDLETMLRILQVDKDLELGLLQTVNSNRFTPIRKFKRNYATQKEEKKPFQCYFLSGCPSEMPHSFAARIVYEIIETESLELNKSVNYCYDEDELRKIKIEPLPLADADVNTSKKKFKEYVQKRFSFANTQSFESFIETGLPKLLYSHILTVFRITEDKWECGEELFEYLQWLLNTFQTAHQDVPTFIFLFVVNIKNLHDQAKIKPSQLNIIQQIEQFCEKNDTAIFKELVPLKQEHIESWFTNLGVDNPNDVQPIIKNLRDSLAPQDRLIIEDEPRFHMKDVEPIQEKVVKYFRNKK